MTIRIEYTDPQLTTPLIGEQLLSCQTCQTEETLNEDGTIDSPLEISFDVQLDKITTDCPVCGNSKWDGHKIVVKIGFSTNFTHSQLKEVKEKTTKFNTRLSVLQDNGFRMKESGSSNKYLFVKTV